MLGAEMRQDRAFLQNQRGLISWISDRKIEILRWTYRDSSGPEPEGTFRQRSEQIE